MHLIAIGGESIVVKAKNTETGKLECFKIARLDVQGVGKSAPASPKIIEKFSGFLGREKVFTNTRLERFFEGCKIQEELYDVIVKEKRDFSIPKSA
jgi:hypothetical protein